MHQTRLKHLLNNLQKVFILTLEWLLTKFASQTYAILFISRRDYCVLCL